MGKDEEAPSLFKCLVISLVVFVILSLFSLKFTHKFKAGKSSGKNNSVVFVLGTKPFKMDSTEKMLNMSDEELFNVFNNNIHPFFRRLKAGLNKATDSDTLLIISAGKNQKKITKKILNQVKREGLFYSCKSTKEEILALKYYLEPRGITSATIVSDDYHAFRVLLLSRYYNLKDINFVSTSYKYSFIGYAKIYFMEQFLFTLSYLSFPLNLIGIGF
jgi:hypothetical protein